MGAHIRELKPEDRDDVAEALGCCGAFTDEEVVVALELFDADGREGYRLFGAEIGGRICGYVCVGRAALTESSWYLYWLCVHPAAQRQGVGTALRRDVERFVWAEGGRRLVIETSGRPDYHRARRFYERAGYVSVGLIRDFYRSGDDCVVYAKQLIQDDHESQPAT